MDADEEREIVESMREALRRSRGRASFFEWAPNRDLEELGVADNFRESLEKRGEPAFSRLRSRGRGNDPPDCEAVGPNGESIAIEVTELVDPRAIIAYKANKFYDWSDWTREHLQAAVHRLLKAKASKRPNLKGGPFAQYTVLIYTDEPMLPYIHATNLLSGLRFSDSANIDRAVLLISYDPAVGYCPYAELSCDA
jgi:hypothetical protein